MKKVKTLNKNSESVALLNKSSKRKQLKGVVVSTKMEKTIVVKVTTTKIHPVYKKRYRSYKKYFAHNLDNGYKLGDSVVIEESRPMSGKKRWVVTNKVKTNHK
ncbi:MAG: 30S ribosomal protein S17 [Candidatus Paceibacterota bacterium]|jgi:small subunit ribosomal protein S17